MRTNGTIQYDVMGQGGVNEYGEPMAAQCSWSDPIPCSVAVNSDTRKGTYEDGKFRQASFTILIERQDLPEIHRVRIMRYEEDLGEYGIISIEPLALVGRVKLIV